jgi:hypothetical protein
VVICVVTGVVASSAPAERRPPPDPSELWRSYPLEQKPATVAKNPTPAAASKQRNPHKSRSAAAKKGNGRPPDALTAAAGAVAALLVLAALALRHKRRRPAAPPPAHAAPVAVSRAAPIAAPHPQRGREPAPQSSPPQPAPEAALPTAAPAERMFEPAPTPVPAARPRNAQRAAARKPVTCQIRWNRRGRTFYAVSVDSNGIEHMLASSPRIEEGGPAPPDEMPEARAALRQLAKDLRDRGWRPLRAKGIDFDERRWYARRFRWPTEGELAQEGGHGDPSAVDEHVSGRSAGER